MKIITKIVGWILIYISFQIIIHYILITGQSFFISIGITMGISFLMIVGWELYEYK